ncbi:hypothetical protein WJX84_005387 [Apatococcus fuscideae]|uniref:Cysteine-rich transmembrane domain-containing protein n=1 Tax=Apatococcus fuscideae TaxID=2026836 RepID=A0AAW1TBB4_9CHLO
MVATTQLGDSSSTSTVVEMPSQMAPQGPCAPPPGYPLNGVTPQFPPNFKLESRSRDEEKGCIEGCLAALCCCFMCEECCGA